MGGGEWKLKWSIFLAQAGMHPVEENIIYINRKKSLGQM